MIQVTCLSWCNDTITQSLSPILELAFTQRHVFVLYKFPLQSARPQFTFHSSKAIVKAIVYFHICQQQ